MNRDWNDFKSLHSNISGAREAFENICETLFRKINKNLPVSQVKVHKGDEGIDIFIGELGIEPITVIQCKFFIETLGESQKTQIRNSFKTAISSSTYEIKQWVLCIPMLISIDEHSWWFKWKTTQIKNLRKEPRFIELKNGNELIDLLKEHNLYNQAFKIDDSLKINAIYNKICIPNHKIISEKINPKTILFNSYSSKSEPYYLERAIDIEFKNSLELNNLWIFGKSGFGKTALVNRNLSVDSINYCFCDLSPINVDSSNEVIEEIINKVEEKFNLERNNKETNKIKQLTNLLCQTNKRKIIIVVDELSVVDKDILKAIATDLTKLAIHFANSTQNDELKFVVSTIFNPNDVIENKSKALEHFQYINCDEWENDIEKLYNLLCTALEIDLSTFKNKILNVCENSPRILKTTFRKIISQSNLEPISIEKAIKLTTSEVVK